MDRYKETLFNTAQTYIPGCRFLDLFAGSGAIGIEALSRGAESCVFIENNRNAVKVINENLEFTHLADKAYVITGDFVTGMMQVEKKGPFDVVFLDPPYDHGLEQQTLSYLATSRIVSSQTLVIVETLNETDLSFAKDLGFSLIKEKRYRTNRHCFFKKED